MNENDALWVRQTSGSAEPVRACERPKAFSPATRGAKTLIRLVAPFALSLAFAVGAGTLNAAAQDVSECPTILGKARPFKGGYCRYDAKNQTVIVFVHGVIGDYNTTWTNESTKQYWPSLLVQDPAFSSANIYVHPYISPKIDTAQKIEELATRLGDYLASDNVISSHSHVVFVAHSMGGLIVRAFLLQQRLPPDKVPLIYFFGTPSAGANIANVAALVSSNPQFRDMLPFKSGGYVEDLATRWLSTSQDQLTAYPRSIWSYCAFEKKGVLGKIVVDELSAIFLCNVRPRALLSDHIDMVKPGDRQAEPYRYFVAAYQFARSQAGKNVGTALGLASTAATTAFLQRDVAVVAGSAFRFKREQNPRTIEVGCEQRKTGILEVAPTLEGDEELFAARPIPFVSNLSRYLFGVETISPKLLRVRYFVEGVPQLLDLCPSNGSAQVFINYVTVRPVR